MTDPRIGSLGRHRAVAPRVTLCLPDSARYLPHRIRMQICPNCASELDDRDIMCASCGHAANTAGQIPPKPVVLVDKPATELVVASPDATAKPKGANRNAILALGAIGAIAVVIFVVFSNRTNIPA